MALTALISKLSGKRIQSRPRFIIPIGLTGETRSRMYGSSDIETFERDAKNAFFT